MVLEKWHSIADIVMWADTWPVLLNTDSHTITGLVAMGRLISQVNQWFISINSKCKQTTVSLVSSGTNFLTLYFQILSQDIFKPFALQIQAVECWLARVQWLLSMDILPTSTQPDSTMLACEFNSCLHNLLLQHKLSVAMLPCMFNSL